MAKYNRNSGKSWTKGEVNQLKELAAENTPTRVIGLKLGRTETLLERKRVRMVFLVNSRSVYA